MILNQYYTNSTGIKIRQKVGVPLFTKKTRITGKTPKYRKGLKEYVRYTFILFIVHVIIFIIIVIITLNVYFGFMGC